MCDGAVEGSAFALRLQQRLLAKACTVQLQSDFRGSSQDVPHVSSTLVVSASAAMEHLKEAT
jgi:hypothetical protein